MISPDAFETKSFRMGAALVCFGTLATAVGFGFRYGVFFFAGGLLSALNLWLLRRSINSALSRSSNPKLRTIGAYVFRLLLIPLCLYAIMRLFFSGIIAAVAGFAVFGCGIFLVGVLEIFKGSPR
jgi:hypothetical protein